MATARVLAANLLSGLFTNISRIAIQAVLLPVMAHLLGPAELGLYALALPLISFVMLLADAGLGDSLAREKGSGTLVWSSAFWGLLLIGASLMIVVWFVAIVIGHVSGQPRLASVVLPLSVTLLLVVITVIPNAKLLQRGNLVPNAIADLIGNLVGAATGILLALHGFGVWAMVALYVTTYAMRAVVLNIAFPFWPRAEFSLQSLFAHTGMGSQILGTRLIDLLTRMYENSQVSRHFGASALGGYSYANQIGYFAANSVGNPLWANLYYVAINRSAAAVGEHYVKAHRIFALLVFPSSALLALAMPSLVPLLFGPQWLQAIPLIVIMVVATPFGNLGALHTAVFFARNRGSLVVVTAFVMAVARLAVVVLAWRFGVMGLTIGLAATNIVYFLGSVMFAAPLVGVRRAAILRMIAAPLAASCVCGLVFQNIVGFDASLMRLFGGGMIAASIYILALIAFDFRQAKCDLMSVFGILLGNRLKYP